MELACCKDFNLIDAFSLLDKEGTDMVSQDQMFSRLRSFAPEKELSQKDIELFFEKYNTSGDGRLKYDEFAKAILPDHHEYAEMMMQSKKKDAFFAFGCSTTFNCFVYAIWELIETERVILNVKKA